MTRRRAVGGAGGRVYGSTLDDCTLTTNSISYGRGASSSTLYNCTVTLNEGGRVNTDRYVRMDLRVPSDILRPVQTGHHGSTLQEVVRHANFAVSSMRARVWVPFLVRICDSRRRFTVAVFSDG
jgi:hypothetical protein